MSFERARRIADAMLYEGYVLYPYRASSRKNRYRWTFGVRGAARLERRGRLRARRRCSSSVWSPTGAECQRPTIEGRLRFLHVERRDGRGGAARRRLRARWSR